MPDDRLSALVDVDMFDPNLLLAIAPDRAERFDLPPVYVRSSFVARFPPASIWVADLARQLARIVEEAGGRGA